MKNIQEQKCDKCLARGHWEGEHNCPPWIKEAVESYREKTAIEVKPIAETKGLREEFSKFCNTDNFSAPPYETDTIVDWWLQKIAERDKERDQELLGEIQIQKLHCPCGSSRCEHEAFDKGLDKAIELIKNVNK